VEALKALSANQAFIGSDPYYRDLDAALWEMVERVLARPPVKVGDTLWSDRGFIRFEWAFGTITGETSKSWIVRKEGAWKDSKINKATMLQARARGLPRRWYTETGKTDAVWESAHRGNITSIVSVAEADQLRAIAEIVGYDPGAK
jgi:hypothetical protein